MNKMKNTIFGTLLLLANFLFFSCSDGSSESVVPGGTGQGGSMARFAVAGDYLYVVDSRMLHVYDVKDAAKPVKVTDVELGVNIETIFPYQGKLFIGSMDGMHIYSLATPEAPEYLSTYVHITSCDPVVVQGNLAYVTLRTDNSCPRGSNQLDIIDISDPTNPQLVTNYQMDSPFGLGIDGSTLFVGEGNNGLTVLNVADPNNIKIISKVENLHAFDLIANNNNLILTGKNGVFQYDYTQPENLALRSQLSATNCQ
jgi:hypothetical protein